MNDSKFSRLLLWLKSIFDFDSFAFGKNFVLIIMHTYIIAFHFVSTKDRKPLLDAIRAWGFYAEAAESIWFVRTDKTVTQMRDELMKFLDAKDVIMITRVAAPGAWRGTLTVVSDWLKKYLL